MPEEFFVEYTPFGEAKPIRLTPTIVNQFLVVKTAKGHSASPADVRQFLEMCAAQGLNVWTKDAFLVGYDTADGPVFNLITSHQALLKRAEFSPQFDGIESGVIVFSGDKVEAANDANTILREGDFVHSSEFLLGGWAKVYRKDRSRPFTDRIHLEVFNTKKSRWAKDPAGMIVKVAEGSALRKAFPSALAGLYCQEEMEHLREERSTANLTHDPIVMPFDFGQQADDRREFVPAKPAHPEMASNATKEMDTGRPSSSSNAPEREPERSAPVEEQSRFSGPVTALLEGITRAKTEKAFGMQVQRWNAIKGGEQSADAVETVEAALAAKLEEVKGK